LASAGSSAHLVDDLVIGSNEGESISILDLLASGTIQVQVPVVHAGERVGELTLISDISALWRALLYTLVFTAGGGALALLAGVLVALRLQRNVTAPILDLVRAMTSVRQTHRYDLHVPEAKDREIGELVNGFNQMLRDVRERDDRLEAHRQNLEHEVADRTRDLKDARDLAESANRAKSDFLATMSHEIRTPMNGMMVMADMLAGGALPARQRRHAEIIARSGRSLLAIINDILDFSKIEAGKLELENVDIDLNDIVENVVGLFAEQARGKGIDLAGWVDPNLPRSVRGDPVRVTQIVTNLVNNALKFTSEGWVVISAGFRGTDTSRIEIAVKDSGIGIPADKVDTIFESFSQADQSTTRQFGGTGLGLTICKRLALAMAGDIHVTSTLGEGSAFSVVIPCLASGESHWPRLAPHPERAPLCVLDISASGTAEVLGGYFAASGFTVAGSIDDDEATPAIMCADVSRLGAHARRSPDTLLLALSSSPDGEQSAVKADAVIAAPVLRSDIEAILARIVRGETIQQPSESAAHGARGRVAPFAPFDVLVADDNAVNREVAQLALGSLGGLVTLSEDGAQALDTAKSRRFDIVFMDGSMPVMDGMTAARHIRIHEAETNAARTPIVALTAHVVGVDAQQWRDAGMDAVVYKPFAVAELARTIESLLPHLACTAAVTGDVDIPAEDKAGGSPIGNAPDLLDHDTFSQLIDMQGAGQSGFVERIIGLYARNAPLALSQMEDAAASGDLEGCARGAHSLKSMSFSIGASGVASHADNIEAQCRNDARLASVADIQILKQALARTLNEIDRRATRTDDTETTHERAEAKAGVTASDGDAMEHSLRRALEQDQFSLLYQPIVDHAENMVGVEALLRWTQECGRDIAPSVFVPVAEKTGLIHELGTWALERAFRDGKAWDNIDISVNVSPVQVMRSDFVTCVERAISRSGFHPKRAVLEITESTLLSAEKTVCAYMEQLRASGVRFALDDFGTGYASLTSLRHYPFDRIKIDQSFVSNLHKTADATIVHAVIAIAKALALKIVAEGVEKPEQQRFLRSAGANFLQGYLFGKPMTRDDITARLLSERSRRCNSK
jgi:EAL domain-containing protein (putative c-di-GMP-specific phosphodiesterase class I)/signal transduction histidine kinase/CheY-like chemotaxis protein